MRNGKGRLEKMPAMELAIQADSHLARSEAELLRDSRANVISIALPTSARYPQPIPPTKSAHVHVDARLPGFPTHPANRLPQRPPVLRAHHAR